MLDDLYDEHPILFFIAMMFVGAFILLPIIFITCFIYKNSYDKSITGIYEYTDMNNYKGYAIKCYTNGANLICYTKDDKIIQVIEYQRLD